MTIDVIPTSFGGLFTLLSRVALTLLVISLVRFYLKRSARLRTFTKLKIPGPSPNFWLGNLKFRQYDRNKREDIGRWFGEFGNTFGYYDADRPVLVTKDLQLIQEVFVSRSLDFPNRLKFPMNIEPFKSSILGTRDKRWRTVRKMLTPTFTAHKVCQESTKDAITISIRRTMDAFKDEEVATRTGMVLQPPSSTSQGKRVDCIKLSQLFTLDVISKIAFNIDETDVFNADSELVTMVEEFVQGVDGVDTWLCRMFPFLVDIIEFLARYVDLIKMVAVFDKHLNKLIGEYRSKKEIEEAENKKNNIEVDSQEAEEQAKKTVFDFMLFQERSGNLTKNETIGNLMVILFAGYETSASCLTYTLWLLAQYPQYQDRLRAELTALIPDIDHKNRLESVLEHVRDLKCELLDRIIFESLRLYPPVIAFVNRELSGSVPETTVGEFKITQEMAVELPVWSMHHCPDNWPDPFLFNPERTNLPIPGAGIKNLAFAGFGLGQRQCIGMNLALYELRQMLSTIVLTYRWTLPDGINVSLDKNGMFPLRCAGELLKPAQKIILDFFPL